jgi:hypothetical protein
MTCIGWIILIFLIHMWLFPQVNPIVSMTYTSMGHHVVSRTMYLIVSQDGLVVRKIICGNGLWNID